MYAIRNYTNTKCELDENDKYQIILDKEVLMKEEIEIIKEADKIINELNDKGFSNEKIEMTRVKLENTVGSISDVVVQGGQRLKSREDALLLLAEMTKSTDGIKKIYSKIPIENRNLRLYFDKVYFNVSNKALEAKYGIGTRRIQKIVKKYKNIIKSSR